MQTSDTTGMVDLLHDAVSLAKRARIALDESKSMTGPKYRDALKTWDIAMQNAFRLQRNLRLAGAAPKSLEDELDDLLDAE